MKKLLILALSICFNANFVLAQSDYERSEGVTSFKAERDSWRRSEAKGVVVGQEFIDSMGKSGIKNITDAEQVFCYEVGIKTADYTGYTIDNMALTGFCGILNKEVKDMVIEQFLGTPENMSDVVDRCVIRPRLMLRFIRGVDSTDVLLSSPCYSFSIFYGGKVKSYNFTPGAELIDTIISSFEEKRMDFTSPALLGQVIPIGVAQNEEQKAVIDSRGDEPVRNWRVEEEREEGVAEPKSGWNNLQF